MKKLWPLLFFTAFAVACSEPNRMDDEWNEAVERFTSVVTSVDSIYLGSSSLEEMEARIDEINAVENVINAYVSGNVLFIKIDGWGTVGYPFDGDYMNNQAEKLDLISREFSDLSVWTRSNETALVSDYSACVLNGQHLEREWTRRVVKATEDMFRACGVKVRTSDHHPTPAFFRKEIYDYDLIFYIGHGYYDEETDLHWVETAETFVVYENEKQAKNQNSKMEDINLDDEIRVFRSVGKRDSDVGIVFQYYISEKYVRNSDSRFAENGKAVIFMVPCQTLMGNKMVDEERSIDDDFAQAFFNRGAGLYIGYDESSSSLAQFGGMRFFANLLSGESFEKALIMPESDEALLIARSDMDPAETHFIDPQATYTYEHCEYYDDEDVFQKEWTVARHALPANGFQMDSYLVSPQMSSVDNPLGTSHVLDAFAYFSPEIALYPNLHFTFIDSERLKYGFSISKDSDPASGKRYSASMNRDSETHRVSFQRSIPSYSLEAHTEYHVWPYIADGSDYNYGSSIIIKTGEQTQDTPILPENLVAYYPFDGNADDASGHSNHGILSGNRLPELTTDRFGHADSAYEFGGYYNSGWIRVPNSESLIFDKAFTVSFWIQHSEFAGMDGWGNYTTSGPGFAAFCKAGDGNATYPGLYIMTGKGENGQGISVSTNNSNGNAHSQSNWNHSIGYSKSDYDLGDWLHIVLVVDNTEKILYLDGVEVARDVLHKEANFSSMNAQDIYIGVMGGSTGWGASRGWYPFYGKIDDIKVFNCAVSSDLVPLL